jgi:hypothetical protein
MLLRAEHLILLAFLSGQVAPLHAQNPKQIAEQAVQTELAASHDDHTPWLYFETTSEPKKNVKKWVAEAQPSDVERVVERNGQLLSEAEQRQEMEAFMRDTRAQARQRKSGQHDDEQAAELLRILPDAFIWTIQDQKGGETVLHFKPNPQFDPPDLEARVFAAMEGDMIVDTEQHRIVSLKGRLIRDVKILGGLVGNLQAGGTFDVERREVGKNLWQITETHVHIKGHILLFKTISEDEDDVRTSFRQLPLNNSMEQAKGELLNVGKVQANGPISRQSPPIS